jgi:hypothetical protein
MEYTPDAAWLSQMVSAAASDQQGAGNLLRTVIVVGVLGSVLLGWFLLRGYKRDD